jgi:hypothetical protein
MNRLFFRRMLVGAGGAVVVASVARADAPGLGGPDSQYGKFDDTTQSISDNHTNLTWERNASNQLVSQHDAFMHCQGLSLPNYPSGWRMPSYKELLTIVDESPHVEYIGATFAYKAIDPHAFGLDLSGHERTPTNAAYWSSSLLDPSLTCQNAASCAYLVEFTTGSTAPPVPTGSGALVRCVHD